MADFRRGYAPAEEYPSDVEVARMQKALLKLLASKRGRILGIPYYYGRLLEAKMAALGVPLFIRRVGKGFVIITKRRTWFVRWG